MIKIDNGGFTVRVDAPTGAAENYVETMQDIIELLQNRDGETTSTNFYLLELLKAMLPDSEQAKLLECREKKLKGGELVLKKCATS
jgi:hypothetical protein